MPGDNIKVAVRVRPFSDREKGRSAKLIVQMEGSSTLVANPENPRETPKRFTYDHSYWSHDGFSARPDGYHEPSTPKYVDQMRLFKDLGMDMLENAWGGYNCSIFAYGQTGSGKSYSIMGHGNNLGLVPRTCEQLFKDIGDKKETGVSYEVTCSMLEIYNEQVRDLLNKRKTPQGGLRIKQHPSRGFYVEALTIVPVGSYKDIRMRMSEGDRQRTIAATKMNETSSRAHTIVTINFKQNVARTKTTKTSNINLVDLAGSERAKQTEATGDRFEEAKNINKSLLTLGNVIQALCQNAKKKGSAHVPFRDSVLTKLLESALGGNSKTCMIAAISPDAENYEQTLSTLRYADRAKSIKTTAVVNQEATDKLIKELIAEKERLLQELKSAKTGQGTAGFSDEEIKKLKEEQEAEIARYKEQMQDTEKSWEKRLAEARHEMEETLRREQREGSEEKNTPHFSNLNEDPALSNKLLHILRPGKSSTIGSAKDGETPAVTLNGLKIAKRHSEVLFSKSGVPSLQPIDGLVLHNGREIKEITELHHQDRIRFGSNNLFVFNNPKEAETLRRKGRQLQEITYDFAQNEIATHSGLDIGGENTLLKEEVMSIMQLVYDVNAMAEDMDKTSEFSILLVSAEARGLDSGRTEIFVKMKDLQNSNEYLWDKAKFLNRQVHMQETFQAYDETGKVPDGPQERDPFWEPHDTPVLTGIVSVPLNYLAHLVEFQEDPLTVVDYQAQRVGFLKVDLVPCNSSGNEDVDIMVDDPMDLVGKTIHFKVKILQAMNLPDRFEKTWCKYRLFHDSKPTETNTATGKNPHYEHERLCNCTRNQVDHKFIDYLRERSLAIEVWGQQGQTGNKASHRRDNEKQRLLDEVEKFKSENEKLQEKLDRVLALVNKMSKTSDTTKIKKIIQG